MFYSLSQHTTIPSANGAWQSDPFFLSWPATYTDGLKQEPLEKWQLEVGGLVEKPTTFKYSDLTTFTRILQNRRLVFSDGFTIRATWEGFVLQELLHRVQPSPEALYLKQTDALGHSSYLSLKSLMDQRALFCMRVNGKVLPPVYGGPLRLLVFNRYAHKGLGQLSKLELVNEPGFDFLETRGYDREASITPGPYYACDLQTIREIKTSDEVTDW